MPRAVDAERRRREIAEAVWRVAAAEGLAAVTFRRIAAELGSSTTVITESFRSRDELLDHARTRRITQSHHRFQALATEPGHPFDRLRRLLLAAGPLDPESLRSAQLWPADQLAPLGGWVAELLDRLGQPVEMTELLVLHVQGLNAAAAHRPGEWPPERAAASIDRLLAALRITRRCRSVRKT